MSLAAFKNHNYADKEGNENKRAYDLRLLQPPRNISKVNLLYGQ